MNVFNLVVVLFWVCKNRYYKPDKKIQLKEVLVKLKDCNDERRCIWLEKSENSSSFYQYLLYLQYMKMGLICEVKTFYRQR